MNFQGVGIEKNMGGLFDLGLGNWEDLKWTERKNIVNKWNKSQTKMAQCLEIKN